MTFPNAKVYKRYNLSSLEGGYIGGRHAYSTLIIGVGEGVGGGLAIGSPSLPVPRLRGLGRSVLGGVPSGAGDVGAGLVDMVGGVFARRSKVWRAAGSGWSQ